MRVLFAAIAVATARAEELPSEVEELRAAAAEAISPNSQSGSIDFLKLTNRLAELGDYDFLGLLLQKTISDVRPEYSEMIVAKILDAPTGEEFTPDLAEALIDCIEAGDCEVATRRRGLPDHRGGAGGQIALPCEGIDHRAGRSQSIRWTTRGEARGAGER